MLTLDQFDKTEVPGGKGGRTRIQLTPKEPIAGLDNLAIFISRSQWTQGDKDFWGWEWRADGHSGNSSYPKSRMDRQRVTTSIPSPQLALLCGAQLTGLTKFGFPGKKKNERRGKPKTSNDAGKLIGF